jgi:hypothetical protein
MSDSEILSIAADARASGDETATIPVAPPVKRYFNVEFDCVSFTLVTDDPSKITDMIKQWYLNAGETEAYFREKLAKHGDPCVVELTEEEAATKKGFDDRRGGGSYPINTFELGALLSSEY